MSSTDFVSYDDEDLNLDLLLGIPMMMNTVKVNLFRTLIKCKKKKLCQPGGHFHEDRTINVASRVLKRTNAPPPGAHVFEPTGTIFELAQDIIGTNHLIKFHDDGQ
ncbi:hypothetical protein DPMN_085432 [Dreissena polymorpha]|uniref:Uncharacterized protein n=1 Tax=Dreissena polymorpha TaxID=45954 RepID=A0A9D3YG66_DREPO|nr:hypothetical protein DPMN_085432 [Dreissena polymorpha]